MSEPGATPADPRDPDPPHPLHDPDRPHLLMPVDVRGTALAILATIAVVTALHVGGAFFVPLLMGLMLSYALSPLVDRLQRLHVPRALGAALLIGGIGFGGAWAVYSLSDDAAELFESLPAATQKLRLAAQAQRSQQESAIDKVQRAAADLEQVAHDGGSTLSAQTRGITRVSVERAHFDIQDYLWSGTLGVAWSAGQAVAVAFIAYFLMVSGNGFRRKMVRISGPTFARRRITVEVLDEITQQVHRFLLVQLLASVVVGVATGLAFLAIGLAHPTVWGVIAGVLNLVPYIGTIVLCGGSALVAFVQFGSFETALQVGGLATAIHALTGNLLTPWLTSRANRLNAVVVFVGMLGFAWIWGLWGLVLGVPILTTVKAVCDRVAGLEAIGELLGP
jgi:predicted PurR-regulated permease PerM